MDGTYASGQMTAGAETYIPFNLSSDMAWLWGKELSSARANDLARNDGTIAGAINDLLRLSVGDGLKLQYAVRGRLLGWDNRKAADFSQRVEDLFELWSKGTTLTCDHAQQLTFGQMQTVALTHRLLEGDLGLAVHYKPELLAGGAKSGYSFQMIHPERIRDPRDMSRHSLKSGNLLRAGVEKTREGCVVAYHVSRDHPGDSSALQFSAEPEFKRVPAFSRFELGGVQIERPRLIHVRDPQFIDQTRGIGLFAPVIESARARKRLSMLLLLNYTIQTRIVGVIETPANMLEALGMTGSDRDTELNVLNEIIKINRTNSKYYQDHGPEREKPGWQKAATGDKITLNQHTQEAEAHAYFELKALRELAAATGLSYEEIARDFQNTNYSSARAAFNQAYRAIKHHARTLSDTMLNPILKLLVQEWYIEGWFDDILGADDPNLLVDFDLFFNPKWISPPRDQIDREKEVKADSLAIEKGIESLTDVLGRRGQDVEQHFQTLRREQDLADHYGIVHPNQQGGFVAESSENQSAEA